jgi:hypothetical protein
MRVLSSKTHTIIGLLVGVILLFAPQIFAFSDNRTAASLAIGVGAFILLSELVTTSPVSLLKLVPMRVHLVLDYLTGAFLVLSPWLFGFADSAANVWLPHLIVGILVVGYALITNPAVDSKKPVTSPIS